MWAFCLRSLFREYGWRFFWRVAARHPLRTTKAVLASGALDASGSTIAVSADGPVAVAGYLVTGLGDAIGEPAGTMFGRHHYRVRSLSAVPSTRSLEGSAAVFVMSVVALLLAAAVSPAIRITDFGILKTLVIAAAATLAEAVSPHGWDNATMQIVPTALAWAWMT